MQTVGEVGTWTVSCVGNICTKSFFKVDILFNQVTTDNVEDVFNAIWCASGCSGQWRQRRRRRTWKQFPAPGCNAQLLHWVRVSHQQVVGEPGECWRWNAASSGCWVWLHGGCRIIAQSRYTMQLENRNWWVNNPCFFSVFLSIPTSFFSPRFFFGPVFVLKLDLRRFTGKIFLKFCTAVDEF